MGSLNISALINLKCKDKSKETDRIGVGKSTNSIISSAILNLFSFNFLLNVLTKR